ncbi:MAG: hypothetical protein ACHQ49_14930 [Elusimicrobiota bacterium]
MTTAIIALLLTAPAMAQEAAQPAANVTTSGNALEAVSKGGGVKLADTKPPLNITVDPFETIRPELKPDENLLLAVSPLTVSWRRTHPEFLMNDRVIEPWLTTFSQRPGILFKIRDQLRGLLGGGKGDPKELDKWGWNLTIADEEGRVFHHYEGSSDAPEQQLWSGQNDQGEWVSAGRSYSAVYTFTSPDGSPRTRVGNPILFKGIVHQEDTGMHISLDSAVVFGPNKGASDIQPGGGTDLVRAAADLIKRRYPAIPIAIRVFSNTKDLGDAQAAALQASLLKELRVPARNISTDAARAPFSDQRVEIVLLNR